MRGVPCLRFCDGTFKMMPGCNDMFSDKKSFVDTLCVMQSDIRSGEYQKHVDEMLHYAVGLGIDRYGEEVRNGLMETQK